MLNYWVVIGSCIWYQNYHWLPLWHIWGVQLISLLNQILWDLSTNYQISCAVFYHCMGQSMEMVAIHSVVCLLLLIVDLNLLLTRFWRICYPCRHSIILFFNDALISITSSIYTLSLNLSKSSHLRNQHLRNYSLQVERIFTTSQETKQPLFYISF